MKFYDEQLPGVSSTYTPAGLLAHHDPNATQNFITAIKSTDPKLIQVLAIRHNRDEVTDGIWAVSKVKPHWHVIVRLVDSNGRIRVSQILAGLGIVYRQGLDDELWKEHGVETIGNFPGYAMYLTHETAEAIRDAKEKYDISEIVSNLSVEEILQVREGYIRVSEKRKLTQEDLIALDKEAYDRGYALKTLDDWLASQPFNVRSAAKIKTIIAHYYDGVKKRIEERVEVCRVCIYIQGEPNRGKTYAARHALLGMGLSLLEVKGGGTGKFDTLTAAHDAILMDDETCPNLLNMSDDYICNAYKRGQNNPPWAGKFFVVTSNTSFYDWLESSGMRIYKHDKRNETVRDSCGVPELSVKGKAHAAAMCSRFFLMHVETNSDGVSHLELDAAQEGRRGSLELQQAKIDAAADFRKRFNEIITEYRPKQTAPDWASLFESKDGNQMAYRCGHCGHYGAYGLGVSTCEVCGAALSPKTAQIISYDEAAKIERLGELGEQAVLKQFITWFWWSVDGGLAWFMEQNLDCWDDPAIAVSLAQDKDMLRKAIMARARHFMCTADIRDNELSFVYVYNRVRFRKNRSVDQLADMVADAFYDSVDPPNLIFNAPGYHDWTQRTFGRQASGKHKVCRVCLASAPAYANFCGSCGNPLPDQTFDGDPRFTVVQFQFAKERGCDLDDIPYNDVKARVYGH